MAALGTFFPPEIPTPRPEYPRPHFDRSDRWMSLNGTWDFLRGTVNPAAADFDDVTWSEQIIVPFAWECSASGVGAHWLNHAVYRRSFDLPSSWLSDRTILHFGAVHHEATVWVDGQEVVVHRGGYVPFEVDITEALSGSSSHELVVAVHAPSDKRWIAHGKQRSTPPDDYDSCAFTPSSGIWQSVWLEPRPLTYLAELRLLPSDSLDGMTVSGLVRGPEADNCTIDISVAGTPVRRTATSRDLSDGIRLTIPDPHLWSPEDPHLYHVRVRVSSSDGADVVRGAAGIRRIQNIDGHLFLNGTRLSLRGVLDQGYWPETGVTAPTDDAFVRDLDIARHAGYNLVRKHLKLEDPRFLHHADRLGMLVWAEPASTGRFSAESVEAFSRQIEPMYDRDGNHPSIIVWGLFNEEWGLDWSIPDDPAKQQAVTSCYRRLKSLDESRLVVDNSGWAHLTTDLVDWHVYDEHPKGWADKVRALVGAKNPVFPVAIAVGTIVEKQLMVERDMPQGIPLINSEFGGGWTSIDRAWNLHWQTQELRRYDEIAGWVWTELADIEHETAGIVDANRVEKDAGGRHPADANGETAIVFDITPLRPGCDVMIAGDDVDVTMAVSHHGKGLVHIDVATSWGAVFGSDPSETSEYRESGHVAVEPFRLSEPLRVHATMPAGENAARLHLRLSSGGTVIGHGCLDICRNQD